MVMHGILCSLSSGAKSRSPSRERRPTRSHASIRRARRIFRPRRCVFSLRSRRSNTYYLVYNRRMTRVAINGFGRIGRCFLRAALRDGAAGKSFEVVALNDLGTLENLAYLLKYDTVYGRADFNVSQDGKTLIVNGKPVAFVQEKELAKLPWKAMNVDIVVESTGVFIDPAKARGHIEAGAKRVVISAPAKGEGAETVLIGANEEKFATCD